MSRRTPVVVVVEPETPGNVGTIARAMKNFGLSELKLVNPPPLDPDGEAYGFAGHAREDVLPNAEEVTFEEVVANYHTVGCTAITNEDSRRHVRYPFRTPRELAESLAAVDAPTALVFGREGRGLNNDELARLDEVCSIPASDDYPVLNLGQAATVVLYELRALTVEETQLPEIERTRAPEEDVERFYDFFAEFLEAAEYRDHKREKTARMIRRLVGRAHPTDREVSTLTGLFRRATDRIEGVHGIGTENAGEDDGALDDVPSDRTATDDTTTSDTTNDDATSGNAPNVDTGDCGAEPDAGDGVPQPDAGADSDGGDGRPRTRRK